MEVAVLTARLEADVSNLVRNAAAVDATLAGLRGDIAKTEASFKDLKKSIDVSIPTHQVASAVAGMDTIRKSAGSLRDTYIEAGAAAGRLGPSDAKAVSAVAKIEAMTAATKRLRDAEVEAAVAGTRATGGGGGVGGIISRLIASGGADDGRGFGGRNAGFAGQGLLGGVLPGGRRASAAAVTTALGLGIAAAPSIAPAALGAVPALGAGLTTLIGAAGTLKLAFADLTSAAFTTQKGFNALTPVQQQFVSSLRSLDAGLLRGNLEPLAQRTLLPQLTSALHAAFTPAAVSSLQGGVTGFSNAIGGGAQQIGKLFGSSGFQQQFGTMLQQDAGYLRQFLDGLTHLIDAFVRFQVAAGPFLTWLGDATTHLAKWIDTAIQADQANGRLAHFFQIVQTSLQVVGHLLGSIGHLAGAFVDAIGFKNSADVVNLLTMAVTGLANFLERNADVFRAFFAGAVKSAHDMLTLVGGIAHALTPLLHLLNSLVGALGGWRVVLDALVALKLADMLARWALGIRLVGAASAGAAGKVSLLRLGLLSLGGPEVLGAIAGLSAALGPLAVLIGALVFTPSVSADKQGAYAPVGTGLEILYQAGKRGQSGRIPVGGGGFIDTRHLGPREQRAYAAGIAAAAGPSGIPKGITQALSGIQSTFSNIIANPAFGVPAPLQGTGRAGVLPTALDNAILAAQYSGSVPAQRAAIQAGISWIDSHIGSIKDATTRGQYLSEGISLKSQLASLATADTRAANQATARRMAALRANISGHGAALQTARTALFGGAAAGNAPGDQLHAVNVALRFAGAQMESLKALQDRLKAEKQTAALKIEETRIQGQINSTQRLIVTAQRDQLRALKEIAQTKFNQQIDRLLGIGGGVPGLASLGTHERTVLLAAAKRAGISIPGGGSMPLERLIASLQSHGVEIPKATLNSLAKINEAIHKAREEHRKLSVTETENITARLDQINQTLKQTLASPNTYHLPSVAELMKGLKGSHSVRMALAQRLTEVEALGGKIPSGPTAFGLPVGGGGVQAHRILVPSHVSGSFSALPGVVKPSGWWNNPALEATLAAWAKTHPARDIDPRMGPTASHVTININGYEKDPKVLAAEIRREFTKTARRNATQTRGPNAGRNLGHN